MPVTPVAVSLVWRNQPICQLNVDATYTVLRLKTLIEADTGIPQDEQLLICAEHVLREDTLTLEDVGFQPGQAIYLVVPWWVPSHRQPESPDQFDMLAKGFWDQYTAMTCWSARSSQLPPAMPTTILAEQPTDADGCSPANASLADMLASSPLPHRTSLDLSRGRPFKGR